MKLSPAFLQLHGDWWHHFIWKNFSLLHSGVLWLLQIFTRIWPLGYWTVQILSVDCWFLTDWHHEAWLFWDLTTVCLLFTFTTDSRSILFYFIFWCGMKKYWGPTDFSVAGFNFYFWVNKLNISDSVFVFFVLLHREGYSRNLTHSYHVEDSRWYFIRLLALVFWQCIEF